MTGDAMSISSNLPLTILVASLAATVPLIVQADGDPAAGKKKAQTCAACHGQEGMSVDPNYPNLAGQYEDYLIKALADYRAGRRTNVIMAPMAANLSDQDIEDLAAWYASQEGLRDLSIK
jgi:cytochrome c553